MFEPPTEFTRRRFVGLSAPLTHERSQVRRNKPSVCPQHDNRSHWLRVLDTTRNVSNTGFPPGCDSFRVEAEPVHPSDVSRMLDLHAPVHDHVEPRISRDTCRVTAYDSVLQPECLGPNRNGIASDVGSEGGPSKDIDYVDWKWDIGERWIARLTQNFGFARIDGDDSVAMPLQVEAHKIARPKPVGREADDGHRVHTQQNAANRVLVLIGSQVEVHRLAR